MTTTYTDAQIEDLAHELQHAWSTAKNAKATDMLRSLLAERKAAIQPKGGEVAADWVLVPREPTEAMALAAIKASLRNPAINGITIYKAMIAAAPPQHVHGDGGDVRDTAEYSYGYQQALKDVKKTPVRSVSDAMIKVFDNANSKVCFEMNTHSRNATAIEAGLSAALEAFLKGGAK